MREQYSYLHITHTYILYTHIEILQEPEKTIVQVNNNAVYTAVAQKELVVDDGYTRREMQRRRRKKKPGLARQQQAIGQWNRYIMAPTPALAALHCRYNAHAYTHLSRVIVINNNNNDRHCVCSLKVQATDDGCSRLPKKKEK